MTTVEFTYSDDIVSDLHKDARGFRPDEYFWEEWTQSPPESKQAIWDKLIAEMNERTAQEETAQEQALDDLRKALRETMDRTGVDWRTALRWMAQDNDLDVEEHDQNFEHFLWLRGLSWDKNREIIKLYREAA